MGLFWKEKKTSYIRGNTVLISQGQANIEIRNNRQQTPLLLAVSQGHTSILELLVAKGADVNVEDEDGDTCLHLALMRHNLPSEREDSPMLDSVRSIENVGDKILNVADKIHTLTDGKMVLSSL